MLGEAKVAVRGRWDCKFAHSSQSSYSIKYRRHDLKKAKCMYVEPFDVQDVLLNNMFVHLHSFTLPNTTITASKYSSPRQCEIVSKP
jgi:hypothetical protein